jgi:hypothetical protein
MKARNRWRGHLHDLVNATLDPLVYAVQWAHDPRCIQRGSRHRRVGAGSGPVPVCRLWSPKSSRGWS